MAVKTMNSGEEKPDIPTPPPKKNNPNVCTTQGCGNYRMSTLTDLCHHCWNHRKRLKKEKT